LRSDDVFEEEINKQVRIAVEEADLILFVVDILNGVTDLDDEIALMLRQTSKPVILVANKADNFTQHNDAAEFYSLGLGDPHPISAINGSSTGDLLDHILGLLPKEGNHEPLLELPRFAIVGRPNAGKSSLLNALIGEERNIVTDRSGTTRDSIFAEYDKYNQHFYLVDTAGIRKKGKVNEDLEYYSVIRAIRAIENADVCIMLIDATRGIEAQDANIFRVIQRNNKGLVVCVNKWDLVEDKSLPVQRTMEEAIRARFAPFTDFPIIFISALNKQRILKVIEMAQHVYDMRSTRIPTHELNQVLLPLIEKTPPPSIKGKYIKIKFVQQLPTAVPTFAFYANLPQWVREPYKRFLENQIRKNWDFCGTPINVFLREK